MPRRKKTLPALTPVAAALEPRALAAALAAEIANIDRVHGDDAFSFDRRLIGEHEAFHIVLGIDAAVVAP